MQLFLISCATGIITYNLKTAILVPGLPRFLIGFCVTPFLIGTWVITVAFILPGAPRWVFTFIPLLISVLIFIKYLPGKLHSKGSKLHRVKLPEVLPNLLVYSGVALVLVCLMGKLVVNAQAPIIAHDATFYLREAVPFAESRDIKDLNTFRGSADGTLNGDIHGPLWPAYLSQSLMFTNSKSLGYLNDQATRVAFQSTVIYLLLAVVALAKTVKYPVTAPMALILLLQVPEYQYISSSCSRDAFRIIPLMLLATVLTGLTPKIIKEKIKIAYLIPLLILSAFAVQGHSLGIIVVSVITLAWIIWSLINRTGRLNILLICGAIGFGIFIGGTQYIAAFTETGSISGNNIFSGGAIAGTPLADLADKQNEERLLGIDGLGERLIYIFGLDTGVNGSGQAGSKFYITLLGLLGSIFIICIYKRLKSSEGTNIMVFLAITALATALPFTGLFDFESYHLSDWFIMNFRYPLHWYPFIAVSGAMFITYCFYTLKSRLFCIELENSSSGKTDMKGSLCVLLVLFTWWASYSAYEVIALQWTENDNKIFNDYVLTSYIQPSEQIIKKLPVGQKMLSNFPNGNYYLSKPAIILTTRPTWNITKAKNEKEVEIALKQLSIGSVVLQASSISDYYDRIPLMDFLNNPHKTIKFMENDKYVGYYICQNSQENNINDK